MNVTGPTMIIKTALQISFQISVQPEAAVDSYTIQSSMEWLEMSVLPSFTHKYILMCSWLKKGEGRKGGNHTNLWKENKKSNSEHAEDFREDRAGGMQKSQNNRSYDSGVSLWLRVLNLNLLLTLESKNVLQLFRPIKQIIKIKNYRDAPTYKGNCSLSSSLQLIQNI